MARHVICYCAVILPDATNCGGINYIPPQSVPGLDKDAEQAIPLRLVAAAAVPHPASHLEELRVVDLDQASRVSWELRSLFFAQAVAELLVFPRTNDILYVQVLCVHGNLSFCKLIYSSENRDAAEQVIPLWPVTGAAARHPAGHLDQLLIVDLDQSGRVCW